LTVSDTPRLEQGVTTIKPFKLRVDWLCHDAYGDKVDIDLIIMGEDPKTIRRESTIPRAIDAAIRYLDSRGFGFWCNVDWHQRMNHKHVTLHAISKTAEGVRNV